MDDFNLVSWRLKQLRTVFALSLITLLLDIGTFILFIKQMSDFNAVLRIISIVVLTASVTFVWVTTQNIKKNGQ